jgi:outer membrane lipoprotein-sorting protein
MSIPGHRAFIATIVAILGPSIGLADTFDTIKANLRKSPCVGIAFTSIIESSVFQTIDTSVGRADFGQNGKYRIELGNDRYLFDGTDLYSYSGDNQQVIIERVEKNEQFGSEVSFVTRLDEIYKTTILHPDSTYHLVKKTRGYANVPDSMVVTIDRKARMIRYIDYLDINEERTRIVFLQQSLGDQCDSTLFRPDFPDSVKRIVLD